MKTDYVDLYLVHWPMDFQRGENPFPFVNDQALPADPPISLEDTWKGMERLVDAGLAKSIGVSNYNLQQLKTILKNARIPPAVLQIELHPYLQQPELISFCQSKNITVRFLLILKLFSFIDPSKDHCLFAPWQSRRLQRKIQRLSIE